MIGTLPGSTLLVIGNWKVQHQPALAGYGAKANPKSPPAQMTMNCGGACERANPSVGPAIIQAAARAGAAVLTRRHPRIVLVTIRTLVGTAMTARVDTAAEEVTESVGASAKTVDNDTCLRVHAVEACYRAPLDVNGLCAIMVS